MKKYTSNTGFKEPGYRFEPYNKVLLNQKQKQQNSATKIAKLGLIIYNIIMYTYIS